MKRVLVAVGDGCEEIETATAVDVLRRAGADLTLASVMPSKSCKLSRGMIYEADVTFPLEPSTATEFDAVVLPGGMPGAENLRDCAPLKHLLLSTQGIIAAICAAPAVVLVPHGLLADKKATGYPADAFTKAIPNYVEGQDVVVDGNIITGSGPGTALKWALKIVEVLYEDKALADKLAAEMLVK